MIPPVVKFQVDLGRLGFNQAISDYNGELEMKIQEQLSDLINNYDFTRAVSEEFYGYIPDAIAKRLRHEIDMAVREALTQPAIREKLEKLVLDRLRKELFKK